MNMIDEAFEAREGESIRKDHLETFLKDTIPGMEGDLEIKQFPSGWSNLTYLVKSGARELVLRRPPHGTMDHGGFLPPRRCLEATNHMNICDGGHWVISHHMAPLVIWTSTWTWK